MKEYNQLTKLSIPVHYEHIFIANFVLTDKPPLTIRIPRMWCVADSTSIGSFIGQISTEIQDDDIVYGLTHSEGYNIVSSGLEPLPFVVNPQTGYVYTNQSLNTSVSLTFDFD